MVISFAANLTLLCLGVLLSGISFASVRASRLRGAVTAIYLLAALSVFFLSLTPIRRFGDFAPSDFYVDPYAGGGAGLLFAAFSLISFHGRDSAAAFFLGKWAVGFILVSALVVAKLHLAAEVLFYSAAILMSASDVLSLRHNGIKHARTEND